MMAVEMSMDPLAIFGQRGGRDWKDLIEDLTATAWESADNPARAALDEWLIRLREQKVEGTTTLDTSIWSVVFGALNFGARFGYGLAKSWPNGPERMADWPRDAWVTGDIPDWIEREKSSNIYPPPKRIAH